MYFLMLEPAGAVEVNYSNPEFIENSLCVTGWSHNEPVAVLNKRVYKNNFVFRAIVRNVVANVVCNVTMTRRCCDNRC